MRISDWSSDVCSSDLLNRARLHADATAGVGFHFHVSSRGGVIADEYRREHWRCTVAGTFQALYSRAQLRFSALRQALAVQHGDHWMLLGISATRRNSSKHSGVTSCNIPYCIIDVPILRFIC